MSWYIMLAGTVFQAKSQLVLNTFRHILRIRPHNPFNFFLSLNFPKQKPARFYLTFDFIVILFNLLILNERLQHTME